MLPAHPAPSPPQQPRGEESSVLRTPHFGPWRCLSSSPSWLNLSLPDWPSALGSAPRISKSLVTFFCRRLGVEFIYSQRCLCNPRVEGVSPAPAWGWWTHFTDENRSWGHLCFVWESLVVGGGGGGWGWISAWRFLSVSMSLQSCLTLCDPMNCSLPGSLSMEILYARILECVAITSSRESSQSMDWASVSYVSCIGRQALYHLLFFFWTGAQAIVKIVLIQGLWYMGHPLQSLVHHPPFESMGSLSVDTREL